MPKIRQQVLPSVPAGPIKGNVDIEVVVGTNGRVLHARVAKSPDSTGTIDRACLTALDRWRFDPARSSGHPIATIVVVRFAYGAQLSGGAQAGVTARLEAVVHEPPPVPASLGDLPVHVTKEAAFGWPMAIRTITPSYTPEAMRALIQGTVEMEVVVLADGTVGAARVVKSLDPGLDRAALMAERYWFFTPATSKGTAVAARVPMVLEFRLH